MKLSNKIWLLAAVCATANAFTSQDIRLDERQDTVNSVNNATAFSIIYGYPLLCFIQLMRPFLALAGPNKLYNEPTLVNATNEVIVRPNVDTLYSGIAVDLSSQNVELTIPEFPDDRFYVFPFYDVWGNNFANLGSLNDTAPGKYLLRPAATPDDLGYVAETDSSSDYLGYINFPTPYGIVLIRILLLNNTTDVATVQAVQKNILLDTVNRTEASPIDGAPALTKAVANNITMTDALTPPPSVNSTLAYELLSMLAVVQPYSPPESSAYEVTVNSSVATAGIANGVYTPPEGLNMTEVQLLVNASMQSVLESPDIYDSFGNGWTTFAPSLSGNFYNNYQIRAYIAYIGYLQLVPFIAIYPIYNIQGISTSLSVSNTSSVLFTFSGKPPVNGFWSLTAYGADNYLIDNPLDVYALGDRSNLTYADGSLVYGADADESADGEFQILIQAAGIPPPANWTGNWLPGPSDGGSFGVNLRYYGAQDVIQNGTYVQPTVVAINVVTDNSTTTASSTGGDASGSPSTTGASPSSTTGAESGALRGAGAGGVVQWALGVMIVSLILA